MSRCSKPFHSMLYHGCSHWNNHFGVPTHVDTNPQPRIAGSMFLLLLLYSITPSIPIFSGIRPSSLLSHPHFYRFESVILDVFRLWCYKNNWLFDEFFNHHCYMTKIVIVAISHRSSKIFEVFIPSWCIHGRVAVSSKVGEMAPVATWKHHMGIPSGNLT